MQNCSHIRKHKSWEAGRGKREDQEYWNPCFLYPRFFPGKGEGRSKNLEEQEAKL